MIKAVWIASIFFFLAFVQPARAQKLQRVRVALSTPTPHMAPLWLAKDKKFFFDNHGDVQLILVSGGSLVAQMLASGEIQMTANAPASLVNLIAGGEKLSFFLDLSNTSPFTVVTQPNLRKDEDQKGKRLGTARFGGSSQISALIALEHLGLISSATKLSWFKRASIPNGWRH